jgi:hypothetical protein
MHTSSKERESRRIEERRKEARYTLILRVGVLEQGGKSSLCLVKNISSMGVQVKFYSPLRVEAEASLRVADEPAVQGRIVWVEGDIAGISFPQLDAATLLRVQQKLNPNHRRMTPRVAVDAAAMLHTGGRTCRASVSDISSWGARVRTRCALTAGDRAIITVASLPPIKSYVRWSDANESGLAFETPIPMQIIADWIDRTLTGQTCA